MKLHTAYYLHESACEMPDPLIRLPDLRTGLNTILKGYLLALGSLLAAVGMFGYLIFRFGSGSQGPKSAEQASTVFFAGTILLGLAGLGSLALILRGKWLCLSSAPEQYHAKWMMFMSILCILTGPALNLGALVVGDSKPAPRKGARNNTGNVLLHEIEKFEKGMPELDTRDYFKLAGQGVGLFSGVFFVLFLRAVALCWGAQTRARFAELYLLFVGLLVAGVVVLFWKPSFMLARPQLLLGLGGGWLLAGLWYFALILSTSIGISSILAMQPRNGANLNILEQPRTKSALDFLD